MKKLLFTPILWLIPATAMEVSPITSHKQENQTQQTPTTVEQVKRQREELQQTEQLSSTPNKQARRNLALEEEFQEPSYRSPNHEVELEVSPARHEDELLTTPRNDTLKNIIKKLTEVQKVLLESSQLSLEDIKHTTEELIDLDNQLNTQGNPFKIATAKDIWYKALEEFDKKVVFFASRNPEEATNWIVKELKNISHHIIFETLASAIQKGIVERQKQLEQLQTTISDAWW